jgi:DNA-binding CsgD family transcriptional regulator
MLAALTRLLNAPVAAAFTLQQPDVEPAIIGMIETGFASPAQRQAFADEFSAQPFRDPFSRAALTRFTRTQADTMTLLRIDATDDSAWASDAHVITHRRRTGLGDAILSLHRASERGMLYALYIFRHAVTEPPHGSPPAGADIVAAARFTPRERLLLDTAHRGIATFYRSEESTRRTSPAASLTPRLRETLEYLLTGLSERQVALKMSLSIHTVHDYVKTLYTHFGVSSRSDLLIKWNSLTGKPPPAE